jgi:ATP/maltotriose-dependent transcriptional regulator MalT
MYPHDIAWAHSRLSEICRLLGNTDEARQHAEQALPLFQQMGDQRAVCYRLQGLAQIARASGDLAEAKRRVAASLALAHELHSRPSVLRALSELVHVAIAEDRPLAVATFLGAIDARNAFLSDSLSRAQIAEIETEARAACAKAATDAMAQARERGQHLTLRGLIAFALT